MSPDENRLDELARRITDGEEIDWDAEAAAAGEEGEDVVKGLRVLSELATAHRRALAGASREIPAAAAAPGEPLTRIGPYHLLEKLGEGGMGEVYLAEQSEPVRRRVALKVIKAGMDSKAVVARFEAERQALAMMDHPCVAKVFDGGTNPDGRPFFVMELVRGLPLTEHCDKYHTSLNERLEQFARICEAVQHAHSKGVIHRDLKPSNILVAYEDGKSTPKIIDFGVAKALSQPLTEATLFTVQGQLIGTPEYMSPEQAEMSAAGIDTRSDVYSLGVILYELLTGMRPFEAETLRRAGLAEIQRIIREVEPSRPSTKVSALASSREDPSTATRIAAARRVDLRSLTSLLRSDLDWVVMKCLEKDPERRYPTASALGMEIRRYLAREPVLAGPPGAGYRIRKFVRRNRGPVIAAVAIVASLLVATIASVTFALIARRAEAREAQRAAQLEQVVRLQVNQLYGTGHSVWGLDPKDVGERLRGSLIEAAPEPQREALEQALAGVNFTDLALRALRENTFERALEAIERDLADQPLVRARLLQRVARTIQGFGQLELATEPQKEALAIRRAMLGDDHPETLYSMEWTARLHLSRGELAEAESLQRAALEGRRRVRGDDHVETLWSINCLSRLLEERGKLNEAELLNREAVERGTRMQGRDGIDTLFAIKSMAGLLVLRGKLAEAEPLYREALEGIRRFRADDHATTLSFVRDLGRVLRLQGKLTEAEPLCREALEGHRHAEGNDHPTTLQSINNMGSLLQAQGKLADAERLFREAVERGRRVLGDGHPRTLSSVSKLSGLLRSQGKLTEAEALAAEAVERARPVLSSGHWKLGLYLGCHADALVAMGRYGEAESRACEAHGILEASLGAAHDHTAAARRRLAELNDAWRETVPDETK